MSGPSRVFRGSERMRPRQIASNHVDSLFDKLVAQPAPAPVVEPIKEPIAVFLDGKWYLKGKMLWDCSDCLCHVCANNGESCHDCKGFESCMKNGDGGLIGYLCPDFRWKDGKEQHCSENGCLCFTCQLTGERCKECAGPIRCPKKTIQCKGYIGASSISSDNKKEGQWGK